MSFKIKYSYKLCNIGIFTNKFIQINGYMHYTCMYPLIYKCIHKLCLKANMKRIPHTLCNIVFMTLQQQH